MQVRTSRNASSPGRDPCTVVALGKRSSQVDALRQRARKGYRALACDYDGTLATDGVVGPEVVKALRRYLNSGGRLLLVSGRDLSDLQPVFPHLDLFELAVLENGALLYWPATGQERLLAGRPPESFVEALRDDGVRVLSVGRSIVATVRPYEVAALEVIKRSGLDYQVICNKGSVMVLPRGVDKRAGLAAALEELGIRRSEVVGVGDAENDLPLLDYVGYGVAVDNALPEVKQRADLVTAGARGDGVVELIERLLAGNGLRGA